MCSNNLVINADDFGYCDKTNYGIIECFSKGAISQASLLVNAVSTKDAAKLAQEYKLPIGLHLNLTEGKPVRPKQSSSLINQQGFMWGKFGFREKLDENLISSADIEDEICAQIERFKELTGKLPLFVDGHQHVHVVKGIREIFAKSLKKYGVKFTRLPNENIDMFSKYPRGDSGFIKFKETVIKDAKESADLFHQNDIHSACSFFGLFTMGKFMSSEKLTHGINNVFLNSKCSNRKEQRQYICEIMVHPWYSGHISDPGGVGEGLNEWSVSSDREHELNVLCSPELMQYYKDNDINLTSYESLEAMM